VVFLPHPNVSEVVGRLRLPEHVEAQSYAGHDVQQLIAHAVVMITDYSSVSFDAAYLDRPVVYFQFDADRVLDGGHNGRPGYYDHQLHGFGPVTTTIQDAVAAAGQIITVDGGRPAPLYARRIEQAFPDRDGRCCERTVAVIGELTRKPKRPRVSYSPVQR
jgi:CDP-glycerol glycerophosphotransferase (TagB/SpsB family)